MNRPGRSVSVGPEGRAAKKTSAGAAVPVPAAKNSPTKKNAPRPGTFFAHSMIYLEISFFFLFFQRCTEW